MKLLVVLLLMAVTFPMRAELKTNIAYVPNGDTNQALDVFVPEGAGPFPTCILVHGGGWMKGDKTNNFKGLFEPLSQAGFAWFTINYRLAPQHRWPGCIEDVETAIRWVKAHAAEYKADPQRIALIGESAGGHLVSLAGVRAQADTRVAAVVPFYAPHDMELQAQQNKTIPVWAEALFGFTELNEPAWKTLRDISPINHIRPGLPPYLLIHGTKDDKVLLEQSLKFQEKMKAAGNVCDLITVEGGAHGIRGWEKMDPGYKDKLTAWLYAALAVKH
jgi:alpha-L-fucosidase 2